MVSIHLSKDGGLVDKKCLKISNGESEQTIQWPMGNQNGKSKKNRQYNGQGGIRTVNQRRTDNTMANGESEP
jgi:hypothetical protein